jgi:hypothetical protein
MRSDAANTASGVGPASSACAHRDLAAGLAVVARFDDEGVLLAGPAAATAARAPAETVEARGHVLRTR